MRTAGVPIAVSAAWPAKVAAVISAPTAGPNARKGFTALGIAVLLQATGPLIVREATAPGLTFAFHRLWIASILMSVLAAALRRPVTWATVKASAPAGLIFALQIGFFFTAVRNTSIANATLLGSAHPLVLLFVTRRMFGERAEKADLGVVLLALGGISLVILGAASDAGGALRGDVAALGAMLLYAAYLGVAKRALTALDPFTFQASLIIVATATAMPLVLISGQGFGVENSNDWWYFLAMALVPGAGHLFVNMAHPHLKLVNVSLGLLCIPAVSTFFAWIWKGDKVSVVQIVGIAVVMAALVMAVQRAQAKLALAEEKFPARV